MFGWMPWPMRGSRHRQKWGDKYGINSQDHADQRTTSNRSINTPPASFDGVTVTNMDSLTVPAAGGVDTSAIVLGDFSPTATTASCSRTASRLPTSRAVRSTSSNWSVSHYLLARALATVKLARARHQDHQYLGRRHCSAPSSRPTRPQWSPGIRKLMEVKAEPSTTEVFDSEQDSGRDPGPARDQDRDAERQS